MNNPRSGVDDWDAHARDVLHSLERIEGVVGTNSAQIAELTEQVRCLEQRYREFILRVKVGGAIAIPATGFVGVLLGDALGPIVKGLLGAISG